VLVGSMAKNVCLIPNEECRSCKGILSLWYILRKVIKLIALIPISLQREIKLLLLLINIQANFGLIVLDFEEELILLLLLDFEFNHCNALRVAIYINQTKRKIMKILWWVIDRIEYLIQFFLFLVMYY
jgi:hypothetical protein